MDREQRRREKLYRNFKKGLTDGESPSVYDENDLLDIFDYANDVYDEYVQFEVILLAARLYPESEEMIQRRAFYMYGNLSMTEGAANLASAHSQESALWSLLDLMVRHPSEEECRVAMESILERYTEFDDETAIQIVDACSDLGIFDWVIARKKQLQQRCVYPETFLYEMAMEADTRTDYKLAASLMEELTEREPFNDTFWQMLSQLQVKMDDYADALTSIDYALAIDADSIPYQLTKAQILYDMKTGQSKAVEMVEDVVKKDPDNKIAVHTLAVMYSFENRGSDAVRLLKTYLAAHPSDKEAVEHLLMFGDREVNREVIERYFVASRIVSSDEVMQWAKNMYSRDQYVQCADILLAMLRQNYHFTEWTILLECLYRMADYNGIVTIYRDFILTASDASELDLSMTDALIFVLSLLRCDQSMAAKKLIDIVTKLDCRDIFPYEKRLVAIKVSKSLSEIGKALTHGDGIDIDFFDPFSPKSRL